MEIIRTKVHFVQCAPCIKNPGEFDQKNIDFALEKCLAPEIIFSKHDCAVYLQLYQMLVTDTIG